MNVSPLPSIWVTYVLKKVILPPIINGTPIYLLQRIHNAIAIAMEYHKPKLFITFACNPWKPEIIHSLLPSQQPQDRPDSKFHLLSTLYGNSVTLADSLLFPNIIDIGTLHLFQRHHLLLLLLKPKTTNGCKMPYLRNLSLLHGFRLQIPHQF